MIDFNQTASRQTARGTAEVIPFGKYRGQPVEVLATDRPYVEWLMGQAWFRERYGNVYTLIVNNFQEPSETPEHNALQALFLDEEFAAAIFEKCFPGWVEESLGWYRDNNLDNKLKIGISFEDKGFDVIVSVHVGGMSKVLLLELKPSVGDDYPAVLRQIKSNYRLFLEGCYPGLRRQKYIDIDHSSYCLMLFLERYNGVGVTKDQFIKIFDKSGIKVIFRE